MDTAVWLRMEIELERQALALLLALALGILTGLIYDFLRPLRRRLGRRVGAALDVLFCLIAGAALFSYAMSAQNGRLGLWELSAILLGFLIYMHTVSEPILRFFSAVLDVICRLLAKLKKILKKTAVSAKLVFQKMRECFIIKARRKG